MCLVRLTSPFSLKYETYTRPVLVKCAECVSFDTVIVLKEKNIFESLSIPPSNPILQTQIDPLYTKKKSEILPPYIIRNTSPKVFQKCHNLRNSHHHHHHTFFSLYQDRQNDVYKKGKNCYDKPCFCMYVLLAREVFMYYSMFRQKDVLLHLLLLMQ